ncbi:MAG: ABC transporter permease [Gammaproteobacteria bacterium]|nr:ABC transporter permease [Gammaproteobacteria bacterium]MCW8988864.1 ABC transporter permease [Gammaproteobacteria bacterium]MCW9032269.1 ABC transporter permease [Gammaproteobacteria bacterium]
MKMIWILALKELRDGLRNRWIASAILLLATLAIVLSLMGSAPTGSVKVSALDITVINLASLSVYLIPLIALMLSFDALVGEFERGTMLLLLTYPVTRWQVIMGKFAGHVLILFIAIFAGYGLALLFMVVMSGGDFAGWQAYFTMMTSSLLLGAVFVALGYLVSVLVKERATAIGSAMGLWLIFVVLYDLLLFGALLLDKQQVIGQKLFSTLMLISPTDSYRILNLSMSEGVSQSAGIAGIASNAGMSTELLLSVMLLWVIIPLTTTLYLFQRREL